MAETWKLYVGDGLAAELTEIDGHFPRLHATVKRGPAFDEIAPSFTQALRLLKGLDENGDAHEAVYQRIEEMTRLLYPDGTEAAEHLLHIDVDADKACGSDDRRAIRPNRLIQTSTEPPQLHSSTAPRLNFAVSLHHVSASQFHRTTFQLRSFTAKCFESAKLR